MRRFAAIALTLVALGPVRAGALSVKLESGGKPADGAVVWLVSERAAAPGPPATAVISQRDRKFVPAVTVVRTGTTVDFPNVDSTRHHVYSFSPAKRFELKLYMGRPSQAVLFDRPGIVVLGCNIHDTMVGYVVVVDTPYFGKSAGGRVVIDGIEPGSYQLQVWHPSYRGSARLAGRAEIVPSQQTRITVKLDDLFSAAAAR